MSDNEEFSLADLIDRVDGIRTVMLTTIDERGTMSSRPLTVQRITEDGDLFFIVDANAEWVVRTVEPVNVAFVDDGTTWVSVAGRAVVDDDRGLLDELWDPMTDAFFPDGKENGPVVLEVRADEWEYWTAPNKVMQLVKIARAKVTGGSTDLGASGTVET